MTGSMYAAIAGLKTHMAKLNVIGNNIANVNTQGYKAQRVVFKDAMYITSRGGSDGTSTVGGNNPSQVGYGVETSSIDIDMSTATFQTGRQLDCMINGDGFFVVGDKDLTFDPTIPDDLKRLTLTRVGDFNFDSNGFLVDGKGSCVYGFACVGYESIKNDDGTVTTRPVFSDQLVPLRIPIAYTSSTAPAQTDENGDPIADADGNNVVDTDKIGTPYWPSPTNAQDVYAGATDENGKITFSNVDHLDYHDLTADGRSNGNPYCELDSITIDRKTGAITGVVKETDDVITIGYLALGNVTNPNGVTHTDGPYYKAMDGAGDLSIGVMGGARDGMGIEYVCGSSLGVDENGNVQGAATKMRISNGGNTGLNTGGLESSGADLATEITEMITTQRGYQANTRIITVTDSMLEELVNMKRS